MKLGIFAKTFPGASPDPIIQAAVDAGYAAVQYNWACSGIGALPETISPAEIGAVVQASERTGMEIAAVSATYNMIHPLPSVRAAGRRRAAGHRQRPYPRARDARSCRAN